MRLFGTRRKIPKGVQALRHRAGTDLPRRKVLNYQDLQEFKLRLVKDVNEADSIRDYGGLWMVEGMYLLEPAVSLKCSYASMIDVTPRPPLEEKTVEAQERHPGLKVDFQEADFRNTEIFEELVDVAITHEADYVVVMRAAMLPGLQRVHENEYYAVYEVR